MPSTEIKKSLLAEVIATLLVELMVRASPRKTAGSLGLPRRASEVDATTVSLSEGANPIRSMALALAPVMAMLDVSPVVPEAMEKLDVAGSKLTVTP